MIDKNNPHNVTAAQAGADPAGSASAALEQAQTAIDELTENINTVYTQLITGLYHPDWEMGGEEPMPSIRDIATDEANKVEEIAKGIRTDLTTLQGTVSSHTSDGTIHFTPEERTKLANIEAEANKYIHPNSSVSAGTYRAVTVDKKGHVTAGANPTTLAEYGIIDAEAKGTTATHNVAVDAHNDIRLLITNLTNKLNAFLDVDDETLDQVSEIIKLVNDNVTTLEGILATKVNIADIINNLTTNVSDKPLSAAQGAALKLLIDTLEDEVDSAESKINTLTENLSSHTSSTSNPHGVTKAQVGLGNVDNTADNVKSVKYATTAGNLTNLTATVAELNKLDGVTATTAELNYVDGVTSNIQTQLNGKAERTEAVYYIEGAGTTDTTNKIATWTGTHSDIVQYFNGLTILYKISTAGSTTTTLNINNLGAVTVVKNATTAISTSYAVNSVILLVYTTDNGTAYWKAHDYDANTKTTTGTSEKAATKLFLAGATSQSSSATTYSNSKVYIGTDNSLYSNGTKVSIDGHAHAAGDITSGTLSVARGGTGATTFTSGAALIGAGTGAVTTRAITNNTSATAAITGSTNLVTMNTLKNAMNRATAPSAADTSYSTAMVRAIKASTTDLTAGSSSLTSGTIYIVYE